MQDMTDEVKQAYALGDQLRDLREQADFRPPPRPPYWLPVLPAPEGQVLTYSTAIKWLSEDHGVLLDLLYRTRETEQTFTKGSFDYLSADIDTMTRA